MHRSNPLGGVFPFRTFAIVVAVVVVVLFSLSLGNLVMTGYELNEKADRLRLEIAELKRENARLKDRVEYLKRDEAVEALAREQLGWIRPGDTAVSIVPVGSPPPRDVPLAAPPRPDPNWVRWMRFLLGS